MAQKSTQIPDGAVIVPLADLTATQAFAARLADLARPGDVIALIGDLGMGKTTLARFFINRLAALNHQPVEDVPSPTFTLVQTYSLADFSVYHIDLYRLEDPAEALELGIEDAFADNVSLIEWPDRLGDLLPAERLDITLLPGPGATAREAVVMGHGAWAERISKQVLHG